MRGKRRSRAKKVTQGTIRVHIGRACSKIIIKFIEPIEVSFFAEKEEDEPAAEMVPKGIDVATQTDPEITGVDADDFEEESGDEGSETESSEDEEEGAGDHAPAMSTDKGTSAKPIRKKIELKYYFGEDMPDSEMKKCKSV